MSKIKNGTHLKWRPDEADRHPSKVGMGCVDTTTIASDLAHFMQ